MKKLNQIDYILFCQHYTKDSVTTTRTFIVYKNGKKKVTNYKKGLEYQRQLSMYYQVDSSELMKNSIVRSVNEDKLETDYPKISQFMENKKNKKRFFKKLAISVGLIATVSTIIFTLLKKFNRKDTPKNQKITNHTNIENQHPNYLDKNNKNTSIEKKNKKEVPYTTQNPTMMHDSNMKYSPKSTITPSPTTKPKVKVKAKTLSNIFASNGAISYQTPKPTPTISIIKPTPTKPTNSAVPSNTPGVTTGSAVTGSGVGVTTGSAVTGSGVGVTTGSAVTGSAVQGENGNTPNKSTQSESNLEKFLNISYDPESISKENNSSNSCVKVADPPDPKIKNLDFSSTTTLTILKNGTLYRSINAQEMLPTNSHSTESQKVFSKRL